MWISVFTILDKKAGDFVTEDILYSMAESRLYLFSYELTVPEYEIDCDYCISSQNKKPDPNCEDCQGSGVIKIKSNPNGKFDFWEFSETELDFILEDSPLNIRKPKIENKVCGVDTRIITTNQLLKLGFTPGHLITPEIHYYEDIENKDWDKQVKKILKKYPNHYIVPASCHM